MDRLLGSNQLGLFSDNDQVPISRSAIYSPVLDLLVEEWHKSLLQLLARASRLILACSSILRLMSCAFFAVLAALSGTYPRFIIESFHFAGSDC
mmetsp:Transcript_23426/g.53591  ORF Transcript_23426/g.53591 Transcript_23426/m.53591 type:complete len:94 (-) Transcript_23426:659-940(-)